MVVNPEVRLRPLVQSILILERQRAEVVELQHYLGQIQYLLKEQRASRVQELLEDLWGEIGCCSDILAARIKVLTAGQPIDPSFALSPDYFWRVPGPDAGYNEILDSLLSAYAYCARTTAESMSTVALLDDSESFAVLSWVWAATRQASRFIEIYRNGAQGMDGPHLPEWKPTNPPVNFSTVSKDGLSRTNGA